MTFLNFNITRWFLTFIWQYWFGKFQNFAVKRSKKLGEICFLWSYTRNIEYINFFLVRVRLKRLNSNVKRESCSVPLGGGFWSFADLHGTLNEHAFTRRGERCLTWYSKCPTWKLQTRRLTSSTRFSEYCLPLIQIVIRTVHSNTKYDEII